MFKKIALFQFSVSVAAAAYATGTPECYASCEEQVNNCIDNGVSWLECKADYTACRRACDAE